MAEQNRNCRSTGPGVAGASLVGAFLLFPLIGGGCTLDEDAGEFAVTFATPEGSSIQYTRRKALDVVETLEVLEGVDYTYTTVGAGAIGSVTRGYIYVALLPAAERELSQDELMVEARNRLAPLYGVHVAVVDVGGVSAPQKPLMVDVRGPEMDELQTCRSGLRLEPAWGD